MQACTLLGIYCSFDSPLIMYRLTGLVCDQLLFCTIKDRRTVDVGQFLNAVNQ